MPSSSVPPPTSDGESGIADPVTYYDELGEGEWERLTGSLHGDLEFENTVAYRDEYLPEDGHVLDVGRGAGRYAAWLRDRGYDVTLVDPSAGQLAVARDRVRDAAAGEPLRLLRGSAHRLPFDDGRFDATLCLGGPLSHLLAERRRVSAASELARVTQPAGPVFVSVMGRLHVVLLWLHAGYKLDALPELARTGQYDDELLARHDMTSEFVETHFFRAAEFRDLLESEGLSVGRLIGLEGPASVASELGNLDDIDDPEEAAVRTTVEQLREDPTVADLAAHILAVCEA